MTGIFRILLALSTLAALPAWAIPPVTGGVSCQIAVGRAKEAFTIGDNAGMGKPKIIGDFANAVPPGPKSITAARPQLYEAASAMDNNYSVGTLYERTRVNLGVEPTVDQMLAAGLKQRKDDAAKLLKLAEDLPAGSNERKLLESYAKKIEGKDKWKAIEDFMEKTKGAKIDLASTEQRNALAMVTSDARALTGELRASLVVDNLEYSGVKVSELVDKLKQGYRKAKNPDMVEKIEAMYKDLPDNLKKKELDLVFKPDGGKAVIGEVKTFGSTLEVGDTNWSTVTEQAKKTKELVKRLEGAGLGPYSKEVFFMNGISAEAKAALEADYGYIVRGPVITPKPPVIQ